MAFVSRHPTVVVLFRGFLLMIGFSLIAEGFGYHLPKGYLYAAIGFSILIEAADQIGRRNRDRPVTSGDLRNRTTDAVLRLLEEDQAKSNSAERQVVLAKQTAERQLFAAQEKDMMAGVLTLAERPVVSIMTPRTDIDWVYLEDHDATLTAKILELCHSPSTAEGKPTTGRRKSLPPFGGRELMPGGGARIGTRAPRIAGVCQGALA